MIAMNQLIHNLRGVTTDSYDETQKVRGVLQTLSNRVGLVQCVVIMQHITACQ